MRQTTLRQDVIIAFAALIALFALALSVAFFAGESASTVLAIAGLGVFFASVFAVLASRRIDQRETDRNTEREANNIDAVPLVVGIDQIRHPVLVVDSTCRVVAASAGVHELATEFDGLAAGIVASRLADRLPGAPEAIKGEASFAVAGTTGVLTGIIVPCAGGAVVSLHYDKDRASAIVRAIEEASLGKVPTSAELDSPVAAALSNVAARIHGILANIDEGITALTAGDVPSKLNGHYSAPFNRLAAAFNAHAERQAEISNNVMTGILTIHSSSIDIANGAKELALRTEQQATSLEETAAAMEEIAGTAKNAAGNAERAAALATTARAGADRGGGIVTSAITAMGRIEESSARIAQIVGLIDDIAFQTNLLALNAAVEAARAGDAGKGFAVVASEVRSLAGRTSQASKEIKGLIVNSQNSVSSGVDLVRSTEGELSKIAALVTDLDKILSEIAVASRQQSEGIGEVASAISGMDEITQANAALVEKTALALDEMQRRIGGLQGLLGSPSDARKSPSSTVTPTNLAATLQPRAPFSSTGRAGRESASTPAERRDVRRMQQTLTRSFPTSGAVASSTAASALLVHDDEWEEF